MCGIGWFVSVDTSIAPERKEDGTIDMHNLFTLKPVAPKTTGARLVTDGEAISVQPSITTVVADVRPAGAPTEADAAGGSGEGSAPVVPIAVGGVAVVAAAVAAFLASKKKKTAEK